MKRYSMAWAWQEEYEDPEGEWVRYKDVEIKGIINWKERIKEEIEDLMQHLIIEGYCEDYDDKDKYIDLLNHVTTRFVDAIETGGREA